MLMSRRRDRGSVLAALGPRRPVAWSRALDLRVCRADHWPTALRGSEAHGLLPWCRLQQLRGICCDGEATLIGFNQRP
jgi:hypothetical protein